jgi:hypothetical protein
LHVFPPSHSIEHAAPAHVIFCPSHANVPRHPIVVDADASLWTPWLHVEPPSHETWHVCPSHVTDSPSQAYVPLHATSQSGELQCTAWLHVESPLHTTLQRVAASHVMACP